MTIVEYVLGGLERALRYGCGSWQGMGCSRAVARLWRVSAACVTPPYLPYLTAAGVGYSTSTCEARLPDPAPAAQFTWLLLQRQRGMHTYVTATASFSVHSVTQIVEVKAIITPLVKTSNSSGVPTSCSGNDISPSARSLQGREQQQTNLRQLFFRDVRNL